MNADLTVFGYKVNFKIEKDPYRIAEIQLGSTFPEAEVFTPNEGYQ